MSLLKSSFIVVTGEALAMFCQIGTMHLYARRFDEGPLANYQMVLGGIGVLSPLLGMGTFAAVLYWAGKKAHKPRESARVLYTSLTMVLGVAGTFVLAVSLLSGPLSRLYFRQPGLSWLIVAGALLLLARMTFSLTISYCWARNIGVAAGVIQAGVMGLIPLAVIVVARPMNVAWLVGQTAVGSLGVLGVFLWWQARLASVQRRDLFDAPTARQVLHYGLPRLPAIVGYFFVLSIPVVLARCLGCGDAEVVIIGTSMALLRLLTVSGRCVGYLAVPRISRATEASPQVLQRNIPRLVLLSLAAGLLGTAVLLVVGDDILRVWLHRPGLDTGGITRCFWLAVTPFMIVVTTWPVIDGLSARAHITRNALVSIAIMMTAIFAARPFVGPAWAQASGTLGALTVLAGLNLLTVRKLLRRACPAAEGAGQGQTDAIRPSQADE